MLRISSVWRIRQIKFQKTVLKMQAFLKLFFEILLGFEQLQFDNNSLQIEVFAA